MTHPRPGATYDAVVVGARVAGAATAMLLARRGLRVLAIDRSRYGSDTLSTHALMRAGVLQLHRWGLLDRVEAAGTTAIRSTAFHYADEVIDIAIKARDGIGALYAPRRTVLDALLVDAARESGAEVVHGLRLVDLVLGVENRVSGVLVQDLDGSVMRIGSERVIGADGLRSTVGRLVGAEPYHVGRHASSNVYAYWEDLDMEGYHWYYRPGVSVGAIPTNDGRICIFASSPPKRFSEEIRFDIAAGYHRVLEETSPELAETVARGRRVGSLHGFPGQVGFFRQSWGRGWALVGDAGYFKDPITAHGISDALRDAELLARAIVQGSEKALADYQSTRDALSRGLFEVSDGIASFEWDLEAVKSMHLTLSKEMNREVAALVELHAGSSVDDLQSQRGTVAGPPDKGTVATART